MQMALKSCLYHHLDSDHSSQDNWRASVSVLDLDVQSGEREWAKTVTRMTLFIDWHDISNASSWLTGGALDN